MEKIEISDKLGGGGGQGLQVKGSSNPVKGEDGQER